MVWTISVKSRMDSLVILCLRPQRITALGSTSACEGGAVTQWRISASPQHRSRGGEGGEDSAHGRTLRSIMAPIGLKAVVGESKTIMLILGYWGLIFNHVCVVFYGAFYPVHVLLVFLSGCGWLFPCHCAERGGRYSRDVADAHCASWHK